MEQFTAHLIAWAAKLVWCKIPKIYLDRGTREALTKINPVSKAAPFTSSAFFCDNVPKIHGGT